MALKVAFTCEHEDGESWTLTGTDLDCGGPGVKSVQIFEGGANGILLRFSATEWERYLVFYYSSAG